MLDKMTLEPGSSANGVTEHTASRPASGRPKNFLPTNTPEKTEPNTSVS